MWSLFSAMCSIWGACAAANLMLKASASQVPHLPTLTEMHHHHECQLTTVRWPPHLPILLGTWGTLMIRLSWRQLWKLGPHRLVKSMSRPSATTFLMVVPVLYPPPVPAFCYPLKCFAVRATKGLPVCVHVCVKQKQNISTPMWTWFFLYLLLMFATGLACSKAAGFLYCGGAAAS